MKIQYDQLSANLIRSIAPLYLIAGEEILLVQEAEQSIYAAAKKAGFDEQLRFTIDTGFDWSVFQQAIQNTSLFSNKQCISLNFTAGKLSEAGKKILTDYLQKPSADKLLIIRAGKLDAALQKTTWYKAAEKIGVVIPVWPLTAAQLPAWIQQRLNKVGLQADAEGLQLLAMRTEGNLLATAQEIEKLSLMYPSGRLTIVQIQEASSNNARHNVFSLIDAILQGKPPAIINILQGLKGEAIEPILVLWALTREARQWAGWLQAIQKGQTLAQLVMGNFMLEKRKGLIGRILQHHSLTSIYSCLQHASYIDKAIKGAAKGQVWDELSTLSLSLAGVKTC
jgi:DNA polymerase-3 subunit delta